VQKWILNIQQFYVIVKYDGYLEELC
jgi:hypothetical protein